MTYWIHLLPFACIDVKQQCHSHEMKAGNLKKKTISNNKSVRSVILFLIHVYLFWLRVKPVALSPPPFHPRPLGGPHNLARWLWLWLSSIIHVRNQLFDSFFPRSRPIREFTFTIENMSIPLFFQTQNDLVIVETKLRAAAAALCTCGKASGNKQGPMKSHTII